MIARMARHSVFGNFYHIKACICITYMHYRVFYSLYSSYFLAFGRMHTNLNFTGQ